MITKAFSKKFILIKKIMRSNIIKYLLRLPLLNMRMLSLSLSETLLRLNSMTILINLARLKE
jgi:hypothetical protein